jgi:hypothetical protein
MIKYPVSVLILKPNFKEETEGGILGVFATKANARAARKEFIKITGNPKEYIIEEWEVG